MKLIGIFLVCTLKKVTVTLLLPNWSSHYWVGEAFMCDSGHFSVTGTVWHVVTVPGNGKHWIFQIPSNHAANHRVDLVWDA